MSCDTQDKPHTEVPVLNLPPTDLEWSASFFGLSLPSKRGPVCEPTLGKWGVTSGACILPTPASLCKALIHKQETPALKAQRGQTHTKWKTLIYYRNVRQVCGCLLYSHFSVFSEFTSASSKTPIWQSILLSGAPRTDLFLPCSDDDFYS